ncbi:protein containing methyltransferase domain [Bacteroidales bacterium 6E]|nr:protein containing methyltransferase domain [Bacteroidales bacterium 6E]
MDPIGQAIYNFHFHHDPEFLRVDTNYTEDEEIDPAAFFRSLGEMSALEQAAIGLCRGHVLDVGAGAGCHALELQDRQMDIVALEKSELAIQVMKDRGVLHPVLGDIYHYQGETFDTILLLMNGIGIAGTLEGYGRLLDHLKGLLAPGGQILFDSSDIAYLFEEEDGSQWIDLANDRYYGEMDYTVTYKEKITTTFPWLYLDRETLEKIAEENGYVTEFPAEGDDNNFLARLTRV